MTIKDKKISKSQKPQPVVQSFLKTLRLKNFKSVQEANLELANLNLLVGANSSGKSSLIQAILFLAQNARNLNEQASLGRMDLNGTLVGFGSFEETVCRYSEDASKYIGLSGTFQLATRSINRRSQRMLDSHYSRKTKSIEWSMELLPSSTKADDTAVSRASSVKYLEDNELIEQITYEGTIGLDSDESNVNLPENLAPYFKPHSKGLLDSLIDPSDVEKVSTSFYEKIAEDHLHSSTDWRKSKLEGLTFLNGLPITGYGKSTRLETLLASQKTLWDQEFIQRLLDFVLMDEMRGSRRLTVDPEIAKVRDSNFENRDDAVTAYVNEINNILFDQSAMTDEDPIVTKRFEFLIDPSTLGLVQSKDDIKFNMGKRELGQMSLSIEVSDSLKARVKDFWADVESRVISESSHGMAIAAFAKFPTESPARRMSDGNRSIESIRENAERFQPTAGGLREFNSFLAEKVRYLGPLRWDPREVYGFETMSPTPQMPLGRRGEMLAKKLDQNPVGYFPVYDESAPTSRRRSTLVSALEGWMGFMGIPGKINVEPIGAYGFRIKVDEKALAMIGTGISQVLPVLVLCLLSKPGDLILLEEPELHLNPGIQQKLMEFLLEMSKRDRSFIIETHSEYMVTRLRLIAVEKPESTKNYKIFFTEIGEVGTEYKEISMDKNGFISAWPKNFFDHAGNDLKIIMQKASEIRGSSNIK
jgi:predicted ATPase